MALKEKSFEGFETPALAQKDFLYRVKYLKNAKKYQDNGGTLSVKKEKDNKYYWTLTYNTKKIGSTMNRLVKGNKKAKALTVNNMTPKQKANQARFKKVMAEAKKLRAKNKTLTQAQAVKQAWAIMYSKGGKIGTNLNELKKMIMDRKKSIKIIESIKNKSDQDLIALEKYKYSLKNLENEMKKSKLGKAGSIFSSLKNKAVSAKKNIAYSIIDKTTKSANKKEKATLNKAKKLIQNTYLGATKVKAKKPKRTSEMHTDTKSHNVNIRVVSGIGASMYSVRDNLEKEIQRAVYQLEILKGKKKAGLLNDPFDKKLLIRYPGYIQNLKKQLREQNKLITSNLR